MEGIRILNLKQTLNLQYHIIYMILFSRNIFLFGLSLLCLIFITCSLSSLLQNPLVTMNEKLTMRGLTYAGIGSSYFFDSQS